MKYKITVIITDPNTKAGMTSELLFKLNCTFTYDEGQYGNGYYVCIEGKEFYRQVIDLRYNPNFDPYKKAEFLEEWAKNYWTGKNGAWAIKSLEIKIA